MELKKILFGCGIAISSLFADPCVSHDSLNYNFRAGSITGKFCYKESSYKTEAKITPSGSSDIWWFLVNRNYRSYEAKDTIYYFENNKQYNFYKNSGSKNILVAIKDFLDCIDKEKITDYPLLKQDSMEIFVDGKMQKVKLESIKPVTLELYLEKEDFNIKRIDTLKVGALETAVVGVPDNTTKFKIYVVEKEIPYIVGEFYFRVPILSFIKIHGTLEAMPPKIKGASVLEQQ